MFFIFGLSFVILLSFYYTSLDKHSLNWDEASYGLSTLDFLESKSFFALLQNLDERSPMNTLMTGVIGFFHFGGIEESIKLYLIITISINYIFTYLILKSMFNLSSPILALLPQVMPVVFFNSTLYLSDGLVLSFYLISVYLFIKALSNKNYVLVFIFGFISSAVVYSKLSGLLFFICASLGILIYLQSVDYSFNLKSMKQKYKNTLIFFTGFCIGVLPLITRSDFIDSYYRRAISELPTNDWFVYSAQKSDPGSLQSIYEFLFYIIITGLGFLFFMLIIVTMLLLTISIIKNLQTFNKYSLIFKFYITLSIFVTVGIPLIYFALTSRWELRYVMITGYTLVLIFSLVFYSLIEKKVLVNSILFAVFLLYVVPLFIHPTISTPASSIGKNFLWEQQIVRENWSSFWRLFSYARLIPIETNNTSRFLEELNNVLPQDKVSNIGIAFAHPEINTSSLRFYQRSIAKYNDNNITMHEFETISDAWEKDYSGKVKLQSPTRIDKLIAKYDYILMYDEENFVKAIRDPGYRDYVVWLNDKTSLNALIVRNNYRRSFKLSELEASIPLGTARNENLKIGLYKVYSDEN